MKPPGVMPGTLVIKAVSILQDGSRGANMMKKEIRINQGELAELLDGEIEEAKVFFDDPTAAMHIALVWATPSDEYFECATLYHMISDQTYYIVDSTSPDMHPGETISVDEILDIVL